MRRYRWMKKESGYTLLETIFQVMIFAMFTQLFLLFFYWKAPIERQYNDLSAIQWELFAADFQEELVILQEIEVIRNGDGVRFLTERGSIVIEVNNYVIRKTVDRQGHIPFLTEVSSATFTISGSTLIVKAVMQNGMQKERDFIIGHYPK